MDEELIKFTEGNLAIDMNGTTESDWRELVQSFARIGYDLDASAKTWWNRNKPGMLRNETQPFVEYERQNTETLSGYLKYPYLCKFREYIHSTQSKDFTETKEVISFYDLKTREETKGLEFEINF